MEQGDCEGLPLVVRDNEVADTEFREHASILGRFGVVARGGHRDGGHAVDAHGVDAPEQVFNLGLDVIADVAAAHGWCFPAPMGRLGDACIVSSGGWPSRGNNEKRKKVSRNKFVHQGYCTKWCTLVKCESARGYSA